MTTLEKLAAIEDDRCIHSINYRNAGVGITYYEGPLKNDPNWRDFLVTYEYYPTFSEAVEGEYARIFASKK